ncbi:MAG: DUF2683 family protein [Methanosarcina sp.]
MVQAKINISEHSNQLLNIIKAKYNLKDKSAAIDLVLSQYEEKILEPAFSPAYIDKLEKIKKGKHIFVGSIDNFDKVVDDYADDEDE